MDYLQRVLESKWANKPILESDEAVEIPRILPRVLPKTALSNLVLTMRKAKIATEYAKYSINLAEQEELCEVLLRNSVKKSNVYLISFEQFCKSRDQLDLKFHWLFKASTFAEFPKNEEGLMSVRAFHSYVARVSSLIDTFYSLHTYSNSTTGYLTADELNQYVLDLIPSLNLPVQSSASLNYYVMAVTRKFRFFHDRHRQDKYKIEDILFSSVLAELLELRQEGVDPEDLEASWFSAESVQRLHDTFKILNTNGTGLMSRREAAGIHNGNLTKLFIDRVFMCYQKSEGHIVIIGNLGLFDIFGFSYCP